MGYEAENNTHFSFQLGEEIYFYCEESDNYYKGEIVGMHQEMEDIGDEEQTTNVYVIEVECSDIYSQKKEREIFRTLKELEENFPKEFDW